MNFPNQKGTHSIGLRRKKYGNSKTSAGKKAAEMKMTYQKAV